MAENMSGPTIDGSLMRGRLYGSIIHLSPNSKVDYFFDLNDRIATTRLAKPIANMNDSKTVIRHHPPSNWECTDHP